MIPSSDFYLEPATWQYDREALYAVREEVFVVEQGVPAEEEIDACDPDADHVLARTADGRPIATGRLTRDGRIGRLAVRREWRGRGVGRALVNHLLERARERGFADVRLAAQLSALPFYQRLGFIAEGEVFLDAGIEHRWMRHRLEDLGSAAPESPIVAAAAERHEVTDRDGVLSAVLALLRDARHEIALYTRDLERRIYDQQDVLEQCRRLALSGPRARIRVLIQDPGAPVRDLHRLVELARRSPSAVSFRVPAAEDRAYSGAFLLTDRGGYLERGLGDRYEGEWSLRDVARHDRLWRYFDEVWERAEPADELRRLSV